MSPKKILFGVVPEVKSTLVANEPVVIEPEVLVFLKTEIVLLALFVTARSGLPSPSMSPRATQYGVVPGVKSTLAANEPVVMEPEVLVFLYTETVLPVSLATTKSDLPSPSISTITIPSGTVPVVKSTLAAKEPVVMEPEVLVFLRTETVLPLLFATAKSGLPSPSMSPMAT